MTTTQKRFFSYMLLYVQREKMPSDVGTVKVQISLLFVNIFYRTLILKSIIRLCQWEGLFDALLPIYRIRTFWSG